VHEHAGEQVIEGEGILGTLLHDLLELLRRAVVVHVVEVVESDVSLGIARRAMQCSDLRLGSR
jgi:hypothetical protein